MSYLRAVYDFQTVQDGEIPLCTGDIVLYLSDVDENWACGKFQNQIGSFPKAFMEAVELPHVQPEQSCFAAVRDFVGEVQGDLSFCKGDIVLGLQRVDDNWFRGQCGNQVGIFPVTHVRELDSHAPAESTTTISTASPCVVVPAPELNHYAQCQEPAAAPGSDTIHTATTQSYIAKAVASMGISAQIDEELEFSKGDVVNIIKAVDSEFAIGECNDKSGTFPLAFVEIYEGQLNVTNTPSLGNKRRSKFRWWENDDDDNRSGAADVVSPANTNNQQPVFQYTVTNETPHVHPSVDHYAHAQNTISRHTPISEHPTHDTYGYTAENTVVHEPLKKTHRRTGSYTLANTRSDDGSIVPYARTVYPFIAENANELTFSDNEIVTLIQHIDEQWCEGEIDGKCGIFPTSYVEIIVDCPWFESTAESTAQEAEPDTPQTSFNLSATSDVYPSPVSSPTLKEQSAMLQENAQNEQLATAAADELAPQQLQQPPPLHTQAAGCTSQFSHVDASQSQAYGAVLYDYIPADSDGVAFQQEDVVSILQQLDADWYIVENNRGHRGLCPVTYVDVLSVCAIPKSPSFCATNNLDDVNQNLLNTTGKDTPKPEVAGGIGNESPVASPKHVTDRETIEATPRSPQSNVHEKPSPKPVQSKPSVIKPKPSLKPKPGVKPKPSIGKHIVTLPRSSNHDARHKLPVSPASSPDLHSIDKESSNVTAKNSSGTITVVTEQTSTTTNDVIASAGASKTPPKRPDNSPKVSVFASNAALKAGVGNLDDIISTQMQDARREASSLTRMRAASMTNAESFDAHASGAAPPIPDRKNVPMSRSASSDSATSKHTTVTSSIHSKPEQRCVASSTFYTANQPHTDASSTLLALSKQVAQTSSSAGATAGTGATEHVVPVPRRRAPPRPAGPLQTPVNLMDISPEKEKLGAGLDSECAEIVADLERRIAETDADLQRYVSEKQQLETQLTNVAAAVDGDDSTTNLDSTGTVAADVTSVRERLEFTEANIAGLTDELNALKESLYQFKPEQMKVDLETQQRAEQQKQLIEAQRREAEEQQRHRQEVIARHRETRMRVIDEIVTTESDFLRSISLCHDVFVADMTAPRPADLDLQLLFGNMPEVVSLSQRLLNKLEAATQGKDFDEQFIGQCFVDLTKEMKQVYAPYCRNHDDVITLLEKYDENAEVQAYFKSRLDVIRQSMSVFDLGAILIKPVQRILKYPLLLNELIKNTEETHGDKQLLVSAVSAMTQVAAAINEFKRRKDLVRKYKATKEEGLGEKFSKLSMHSTRKKIARLSQKMVGPFTVDEAFNHEDRKFKSLETAVRQLTRDINAYMEQVKESTYYLESVANDLLDYYHSKVDSKVKQYCESTHTMATTHLNKYKHEVELQALHPLNRLLIMYEAPNKVIRKRHDKLLDYDNLIGQVRQTNTNEVQKAKQVYEALNAQLLDELPKLYELSIELIKECIARFIRAQKLFYIACVESLYKLPDDFLMSLDLAGVDSFSTAHQRAVDQLSQLMFTPKTFNPNIDEKKQQSVRSRKVSEYQDPDWSSTQTSALRAQLRTNYNAAKLYIVTSDYTGRGMMEMSLSKGTLVGVVKDRDPMGNKERWFVDNGVTKGLFPASGLTPAPAHSPSSSSLSPSTSIKRSSSAVSASPTVVTDVTSAGSPSDKPGVNRAISAFDHPTLFDAVCSPTFGQILQPTVNQSDLLVHTDHSLSDPFVVNTGQSTGCLQPIPVAGSQLASPSQISPSQKKQLLSQSESPIQVDFSLIEQEDMSDLFEDDADLEPTYQAMYAFDARNDVEISLSAGQRVKVIAQHDLEGNSEWWLVDVSGVQGYAPANYLQRL